MQGHKYRRTRKRDHWTLVFLTNERKPNGQRKQRAVTFIGSAKQADDALAEYTRSVRQHTFVAPAKVTVGEWLDKWLDTVVKPSRRITTYATYKHVVDGALKPAFGGIPLQALLATDLQAHYATLTALKPASIRLRHVVLSAALRSAVKQQLIQRNVCASVEGLPAIERNSDAIDANCWSVDETARFLAVAKQAGPRQAALYQLLVDTGMRIGEACGLKWTDVDFAHSRLTIKRQLVSPKLGPDGQPRFGPPKTGKPRTIDLGDETVVRLRAHRKHQAELRMAHADFWSDHDLVFSKETADICERSPRLGLPLQKANINGGEFKRLQQQAGVRRITLHGLRHSMATQWITSGEPITTVSQRLGHAKTSITLDVYGHVLPGAQADAAARHNQRLHG